VTLEDINQVKNVIKFCKNLGSTYYCTCPWLC